MRIKIRYLKMRMIFTVRRILMRVLKIIFIKIKMSTCFKLMNLLQEMIPIVITMMDRQRKAHQRVMLIMSAQTWACLVGKKLKKILIRNHLLQISHSSFRNNHPLLSIIIAPLANNCIRPFNKRGRILQHRCMDMT